jgi:uncharacterized protein (TIGR03118 family)
MIRRRTILMRHSSFQRALLALFVALCAAIPVAAQTATSYQQTNLVSDVAGNATHTDPLLLNPWGIAFVPGQPFWIAANNSGFSQQYDATGTAQAPASVKIPPPAGSNAAATPTGVIYNPTGVFANAVFIFATEDGTISTWYPVNNDNAVLGLDHSTASAVYKGLALVQPADTGAYLAVANFHSGLVETYTTGFAGVALPGSFTDPNLPAGYAPFNLQVIGNQVFVTYAVQDSAKHDPVKAAGNGIVNVFDLDGNFVKRFVANGPLNAPWGVVQASANFGSFSNDILIGNFGDGLINVFDPATGNMLGQLKDSTGAALVNGSLWALVFGAGGTGNPDTLYFTAGLNDEQHGLFGAITVNNAHGAPDFTISASPTSATVRAGSSTTFTISAAPSAGFAGSVSFSCMAPAGITCSFSPPTVSLNGAMATTQMTASAASSGSGYVQRAGLFLMSGVGLFGTVIARRKRLTRSRAGWLWFGLMLTLILGLAACGSSNNSSSGTRGTTSMVVTAQSGSISHTTSISLTVQ